jgi:hypothetical protein
MNTQVESSPQIGFLGRCRFVARGLAARLLGVTRSGVTPPADFRASTLSEEEYGLLRELVQEAAEFEGPIIEIGTLLGGTTTRLALWARPGQKVITVDNYSWNPWGLTPEQHHCLTSQVLYHPVQLGRVEQIAMGKDEYFRQYQGPPPALVFLDAWHTYVETKRDIEGARAIQSRIISGHDYSNTFPGVIQAVDEAGKACLRGSVWALPRSPVEE